MEFSLFAFYAFAVIVLFAGIRVITSRNPVHAALYLVLAFFTTGCIWMLMHAEFLAIAIVLVYVGAVMVLFLFVVMMLDINLDRVREGFWQYLPVGLVVGLLMVAEMVVVLNGTYFKLDAAPPPGTPAASFSNTQELARELFTNYVYPFELASLILTLAMVAAVALTLRRRANTARYMKPSEQIAVKAADRMRIVKMQTEKDE
ncbi:MAG: NADH-quinone oxidoreductase subunit J [Rhodocyclaceae bacterium]